MTIAVEAPEWSRVAGVETVTSPALLVYRDRVEENLQQMLRIAGDPERLRPHIKTHKMRVMVELQLALGITKFKCATLAEAQMAAAAGAPDLLVAYQMTGPSGRHLAELVARFPRTKFSTIVDDVGAIQHLSNAFKGSGKDWRHQGGNSIEVLLDLDVGQHRTGVPVGTRALELYRLIASTPGLRPGGLHAYDGHIGDSDFAKRSAGCEAAFAPIAAFRHELESARLPVPRVVAGGSPTFPIHARRTGVECSPGTCVFWDAGYAHRLPEQDFKPAALLLTRVISKPGANRLCLDLGHKALASEMPQPRAQILGLEDTRFVLHSEEHLVIETAQADRFQVGDPLYAIPWHVCPTVALHATATVIQGGRVEGAWEITRHREISPL